MNSRKDDRSRYTTDRQMPGAYEAETVSRRRFFTAGALAAGGLATAAFGLPALGFALAPSFTRTEPHSWRDVGSEADFNDETYTPQVIDLVAGVADSGKTPVYVRRYNRATTYRSAAAA